MSNLVELGKRIIRPAKDDLDSPSCSRWATPKVTILGGGPAGLAAGYFANKAGLSFEILEAKSRVGGNAITFQEGEFRCDSGSHRFHDKDPEMTQEVRSLLGDELLECQIGSQIFHHGRAIDFPLSPINLLKALDRRTCVKAAWDWWCARSQRHDKKSSFEDFAVQTYGWEIARRFLLSYSEKLWGLPGHRLSPTIASTRLKGLRLSTILLEMSISNNRKARYRESNRRYNHPLPLHPRGRP